MNLKQLEYFLTITEEGQITAAAHRLHVAQPPLSYQIKQLENELGVKLLERSSMGVEVTAEGKMLQHYAQQIIDLTNLAQNRLKAAKKGFGATITIGSISSSASTLPGKKLLQLSKQFPDLNFDIFESNTYGVLEKLKKRSLDVAIVRTPFNEIGIEVHYFANEPMVIAGNAKSLEKRVNYSLEDLEYLPLIVYRRFLQLFKNTFAEINLNPRIAVTCDDARTALNWALEGYGVALVPASIAKLSKCHSVPVDCHSWETRLALVWLKNAPLSPFTQQLIDLFK